MSNEIKVLYQFEDFRLDASQRCLWRASGELVSLTPKALETLLVLVRRKGSVVEKDTLLSEVWADTFVEEATLAQNISTLRKVLGSRPGKPFIETVPRRGYRFVADVQELVADEEVYVVEKRRRTNVVATQEIHDSGSGGAPGDAAQPDGIQNSPDSLELSKTAASDDGRQTINAPRAAASVSAKTKILLGSAALVCLALAAAGGWTYLRGGLNGAAPRMAESKFQKPRFTKLTSNGNASRVALSPDGKYLALVERRAGDWVLMVRQISNANTVEIATVAATQFVGLTFSPDSQSIFYTVYPKDNDGGGGSGGGGGARYGVLYKIPMLGGVPEAIVTDIDSQIALSPDSRRFAFVRNDFRQNESKLMIGSFDGTPEKKLASRPVRKSFSQTAPAWSPDGKTLACSASGGGGAGSNSAELLAVSLESGEARSLLPPSQHRVQWVGQTAWLGDGSGIIFPASLPNSQNLTDEMFILSFPDGGLRAVTTGINGFYGVSLTSDSGAFVTMKSARSSNFWVQPVAPGPAQSAPGRREPARIHQNFAEISLVPQTMSWTPDQKVIFDSTRNGNSDVWLMNPDGGGQRPLTSDAAADFSPAPSPDGKFVVFLSNRTGAVNLWRINADGSGARQITNLDANITPGVSTDGRFTYYSHRGGENVFPFLWKVPVEGGEPIRLTDKAAMYPQVSPDGKMIACFYASQDGQFGMKLSILSAEDGALVRQFDVPAMGSLSKLSWSPDGRKVFFLKNQDGLSEIMWLSVDGETGPAKIVESKNDTIFRFALSPADGSTFVYENGGYIQDVILVESAE